MVENAGSAVTRDIDVGPSVIVVVQRGNTEAIVSWGARNPGALRHVRKPAVAQIVIQQVGGGLQPAWAAHYGSPLPQACGILAGQGRSGNLEVNIVRYHNIKQAVPVVIDESAARAPLGSRSRHARGLGNFFEPPSSFIVVKPVFSIVGDKKVFKAVIVVIPNADSLSPSGGS